jgi:hypothetical protein
MTDQYAPFPERELIQLAEYHESVAKGFPERGYLHSLHLERAGVCRSAIKSQEALRERCLIAEMELGRARRAS